MTNRDFETPRAYRQSLSDRLRQEAKGGVWTLQQLQRHAAYDALLRRLYRRNYGWVIKGAVALIARGLSQRGSLDIDLYRAPSETPSEDAFRLAAADPADDWFHFEVAASQNSVEGTPVIRLPVAAFIGETPWAQFHVDLVGPGVAMTGVPEPAPPLIPSVTPDKDRDAYRVYPLADHVADKVAAMFSQYGSAGLASTRYRDLVDLVAIIKGASIAALPQIKALRSEEARRGINLPETFDVPNRDNWEWGYAEEARKLNVTHARTLEAALAIVRPFLDPLLDGTATGVWDPESCTWRPA